MGNRLFVVPILNTMGPVTDPKHTDLLSSWEAVDQATSKYFTDKFRNSIIDSRGQQVIVSWFPVSWSGFTSNPVQRDFGWFTIYDHINEKWKYQLNKFNDGIYWMYNHPDKTGVGNAWGLDWLHNCHYLNILNRMILHRGFFPGIIEIPTADTHSTNFIENYFPFEISNRNSPFINWDNIEADGRKTREVLKWADATDTWIPYHPSEDNHQMPGNMKHVIFRLLDIKTRIMSFPEDEIVKAFENCRAGHDVVIAGYEHDFRDRCDVVIDNFLRPIKQKAVHYPDVEIINANLQTAAAECMKYKEKRKAPLFVVEIKRDFMRIISDVKLFGSCPYIAVENIDNGHIFAINPIRVGYLAWGVQTGVLPARFILGIAGFSETGLQSIYRFKVEYDSIAEIK